MSMIAVHYLQAQLEQLLLLVIVEQILTHQQAIGHQHIGIQMPVYGLTLEIVIVLLLMLVHQLLIIYNGLMPAHLLEVHGQIVQLMQITLQ